MTLTESKYAQREAQLKAALEELERWKAFDLSLQAKLARLEEAKASVNPRRQGTPK
jgi:hypothetical protein